MRNFHRWFRRTFPAAFLFALPALATAQDGFLFEPPKLAIHLRAGATVPNASGNLFDMVTSQLTLDRGDFAGSAFGGDFAITLSQRFDAVLSISSTSVSRQSEFRDWVDNENLPIEQTTRFRRTPITLGLKYLLRDRGQMIGSHAWVPHRVLPYVGAAGGLTWYRFQQTGDFVNELNLDVYPAQYTSSGNTTTAQLFGGAEFWTSTKLGFSIEGRYQFANATLHGDYAIHDNLDLRGFQLLAGAAIRL